MTQLTLCGSDHRIKLNKIPRRKSRQARISVINEMRIFHSVWTGQPEPWACRSDPTSFVLLRTYYHAFCSVFSTLRCSCELKIYETIFNKQVKHFILHRNNGNCMNTYLLTLVHSIIKDFPDDLFDKEFLGNITGIRFYLFIFDHSRYFTIS